MLRSNSMDVLALRRSPWDAPLRGAQSRQVYRKVDRMAAFMYHRRRSPIARWHSSEMRRAMFLLAGGMAARAPPSAPGSRICPCQRGREAQSPKKIQPVKQAIVFVGRSSPFVKGLPPCGAVGRAPLKPPGLPVTPGLPIAPGLKP